MEKQPAFLRDFSKEHSSEERDQAAKEIREKRSEYFDRKAEHERKTEEKDIVAAELESLAKKTESYNDAGFFQKVKDYLAIQKTKAEMNEKMGVKKTFEEQLAGVEPGRPELDEARQMMKRFYSQEKTRWESAPYSKEDVVKNFTEEHLTSLSLEDYALLMKRFPGQMVTHISRHGIRDHFGMYEHSKRMGEWHDSFEQMLASKRILSPLGVALSQAETNHDICTFLNGGNEVVIHRDGMNNSDKKETSPQGLVAALKRYESGGKNFHDKAAIHVAVEQVLDGVYGNERGNEVFVAYPSAHVASQYMFNEDSLNIPSDAIRNDVYVWNRWKEGEEVGMSIDAGVVFLPKNATVDSETGSLYRLDESGQPIPEDVDSDKKEPNTLYFQKTDRGVSSEKYWEEYFAKHPESRPSKVVYYDDRMTPTEALWKWQTDNGIISKDAAANLGFSEHQVGNDFDRPFGEQEVSDFRQLAMNALVEEYGLQSVLFAYDSSVAASPIDTWDKKAREMYYGKEVA